MSGCERSNFFTNLEDPRKIPFFDDSFLPLNNDKDRLLNSYNHHQESPFRSHNSNLQKISELQISNGMPSFGSSDMNTPLGVNKQAIDDIGINTNSSDSWSTGSMTWNSKAGPQLTPKYFPVSQNPITFAPQTSSFLNHNDATSNNHLVFEPDSNLNDSNKLLSISSTTTVDSNSLFNFNQSVSSGTNKNSTGNINIGASNSDELDITTSNSQNTNDIFASMNPGTTTPNFAPFEPNYLDIKSDEFSKTPMNKLTSSNAMSSNYDTSQSVLSTPNLSSNKHSRFFPSPKSERLRPYESISTVQHNVNAFHSLNNTPDTAIPNLNDKITFLNLSSSIFPGAETISPFRDRCAFPINEDNFKNDLLLAHQNPLNTPSMINVPQTFSNQASVSYETSASLDQAHIEPLSDYFPRIPIMKPLCPEQENFQMYNSIISENTTKSTSYNNVHNESQKPPKNFFNIYSRSLLKPSVSLSKEDTPVSRHLHARSNTLENSIMSLDKEHEILKRDNNNNVTDTLVSLYAFNLKEDNNIDESAKTSKITDQKNSSTDVSALDDLEYSYPEGFSSTFYKRVDNNFMFVREIQSKSTVVKFRSNSILEFRLSIPSLPLFQFLENETKKDNTVLTIDTINKALPKKKKYKSYVVQMNLHDLEGKISGLKVSKQQQQQMNSKGANTNDGNSFDIESKGRKYNHSLRNHKKYQGSRMYYKKGSHQNNQYRKGKEESRQFK